VPEKEDREFEQNRMGICRDTKGKPKGHSVKEEEEYGA
jgi:hypothetical protein